MLYRSSRGVYILNNGVIYQEVFTIPSNGVVHQEVFTTLNNGCVVSLIFTILDKVSVGRVSCVHLFRVSCVVVHQEVFTTLKRRSQH